MKATACVVRFFLIFPHLLVCLCEKHAGIRRVNMSTVDNYSPVSSKIQQIITMGESQMNHCCQRQGDYWGRGSTVTRQHQNQFKLFLVGLFWEHISMDAPTRQWNIWLHGSVAPKSKDTLEKHTTLHMSLSQWLFMWQRELFTAPEQREYITTHSPASKFCFLWEALFLVDIYVYINKSWCADSESAVSATAQASGRAAFVSCQCLH